MIFASAFTPSTRCENERNNEHDLSYDKQNPDEIEMQENTDLRDPKCMSSFYFTLSIFFNFEYKQFLKKLCIQQLLLFDISNFSLNFSNYQVCGKYYHYNRCLLFLIVLYKIIAEYVLCNMYHFYSF